MTTLVFRLRNVPDKEGEDVRVLLDEAGIDWYETTAGTWGIALPGIWVGNPAQAGQARLLIDAYQRELEARACDPATRPSFLERLGERPVAVISVLAFCAFVLYVSIHPFVQLVSDSSP